MTPGRSSPSTVATRCVTPASCRSARSSGQCTLPGRATRERSLRSRSTIITCSAASFADSIGTPAGRVPLIGEVRIRVPRRERRSSGDAETIVQPAPEKGRPCSGRSDARAGASDRGSPGLRKWPSACGGGNWRATPQMAAILIGKSSVEGRSSSGMNAMRISEGETAARAVDGWTNAPHAATQASAMEHAAVVLRMILQVSHRRAVNACACRTAGKNPIQKHF